MKKKKEIEKEKKRGGVKMNSAGGEIMKTKKLTDKEINKEVKKLKKAICENLDNYLHVFFEESYKEIEEAFNLKNNYKLSKRVKVLAKYFYGFEDLIYQIFEDYNSFEEDKRIFISQYLAIHILAEVCGCKIDAKQLKKAVLRAKRKGYSWKDYNIKIDYEEGIVYKLICKLSLKDIKMNIQFRHSRMDLNRKQLKQYKHKIDEFVDLFLLNIKDLSIFSEFETLNKEIDLLREKNAKLIKERKYLKRENKKLKLMLKKEKEGVIKMRFKEKKSAGVFRIGLETSEKFRTTVRLIKLKAKIFGKKLDTMHSNRVLEQLMLLFVDSEELQDEIIRRFEK